MSTNSAMKSEARAFFSRALAKVESKSIREWATTAHNKPLWLKIAEEAVRREGTPCPERFAAYMVCVAIGA